MRIIDLQRRLREVGRIRIGEQVPIGGGRTRPAKLETFRFTSRDQLVIEAAAEQWGGTARPWKNAPGGEQWEVTSQTNTLNVIVPPGDMSFSQAYEQWTAGGCKARCDGRWDHLADTACHCDPENRACDIHTRLSVILPDLQGIGVWRLDTQGYYAAVEMGGIVDLVASYTERGVMLPARLRLEQRSVKRIDNGKVTTRNFSVPILDVAVHPLELTGDAVGELMERGGSADTSPRPALPPGSITPVPVVDGELAPTIAEQLALVADPPPPIKRHNAATAVPSTGIKPRTARQAEDEAPAPHLPIPEITNMNNALNTLGVEARRTFVTEFGCKPDELAIEDVPKAVAFVAGLGS